MIPFQEFNKNPNNLLPYEGEAYYYGKLFSQKKADQLFSSLLKQIPWQHDVINMFGKQITTQRKVAWYGDQEYAYTYSRQTKHALAWTKELLQIKTEIQDFCGEVFNSCLLNLYHEGTEGMGWHRDNEKDLKVNAAICSISLGAERKFSFKHGQTKETVSLYLEHGSMLLMKGETQSHWLHGLPKSKKIKQARVNLTFRTIRGK